MITDELVKSWLDNCLMKIEIEGLGSHYEGKVRDCYTKDDKRVLVVSDRISAFDYMMKEPIPFKGQVLNQLAAYNFRKTADIIPNHILEVPDPNVTIAKNCKVYPVEMIVRGYLTGSAYRAYQKGERVICGVAIPEGMRMNQKFETPILTPTTKEDQGHDEDITREEIMEKGIVPELVYKKMEEKALALFERGTEIAAERGLILVDTKYEFGDYNGELTLIDEVHTADSSRYYYADTYQELYEKGEVQMQLSKEFLREWLMERNFMGKEDQVLPHLSEGFRVEVAKRYIELYEKLTGSEFVVPESGDILTRIKGSLGV